MRFSRDGPGKKMQLQALGFNTNVTSIDLCHQQLRVEDIQPFRSLPCANHVKRGCMQHVRLDDNLESDTKAVKGTAFVDCTSPTDAQICGSSFVAPFFKGARQSS